MLNLFESGVLTCGVAGFAIVLEDDPQVIFVLFTDSLEIEVIRIYSRVLRYFVFRPLCLLRSDCMRPVSAALHVYNFLDFLIGETHTTVIFYLWTALRMLQVIRLY